MSRTHTGTSIDALIKGGLPSLPQGPTFEFVPEKWLTSSEAAEFLHVGERAVGKYVGSGQLKASWVGRRWLIALRDAEAFIRSKAQQ